MATQTKRCYVGASAPQRVLYTCTAYPDALVTDMRTVLSGRIEVVRPDGTTDSWACAIVHQTEDELVLDYELAADGSDATPDGQYGTFALLTTPAGEVPFSSDVLTVIRRDAVTARYVSPPMGRIELGDDAPTSFLLAPTALTSPTFTSSLEVGATSSITPGTYAGSPAPTITYALMRDGEVVEGQTGLTRAAAEAYAIVAADVGRAISWRETATNVAGSATADSNDETWTPLSPATPAWFYDAGVGVTTGSGVVTAVADQSGNGVGLTVSGTASARPKLRNPCYELGGDRAAIATNEANSQWVGQASAAASALLHKASTTWMMRFAAGSGGIVYLLDNDEDARLTSPGVVLTYDGRQNHQELTLSVYRGGGNYLINNQLISNVTRSVVHTLTVRMDASTYSIWLDDTLVVDGAAYSGSPSASNPGYGLRFGANANTPSSSPASGWLGGLVAYDSALSNERVATLRAWMANQWPRPVWAATGAPLDVAALSGTKRILFLGDSHTYGTNDTANDGFLLPVKTALAAYGDITWQFIGPNAGTNAGINHDGNPGWTIRGHLPVTGLNGHGPSATPTHANNIENVLAAYDPHVVVVMIGFNNYVARPAADQFANDNPGDLLALLRYIRAQKPAARYVIVDEIWNTNLAYIPDMQAFNDARAAAIDAFEADGAIVARAAIAALIGTDSANYALGGADQQHLSATGNQLCAPRITAAIRYVSGLAA